MKVRILSVIMVALMAFCSISCTFKENGSLAGAGSSGSESNQTQTTESNQLQIIKSDIKLSEEDMVSRIKAEYLLENGGYSDNDEIVVMINLPGDALIDRYLSEYAYAYGVLGRTDDAGADQGAVQIQRLFGCSIHRSRYYDRPQ